MIALRDKQEHTRRRRPWTRAFSTTALKGYENIVLNRCLQLVEVLGNQKGVVDLNMWMSYFAYVLFVSFLVGPSCSTLVCIDLIS